MHKLLKKKPNDSELLFKRGYAKRYLTEHWKPNLNSTKKTLLQLKKKGGTASLDIIESRMEDVNFFLQNSLDLLDKYSKEYKSDWMMAAKLGNYQAKAYLEKLNYYSISDLDKKKKDHTNLDKFNIDLVGKEGLDISIKNQFENQFGKKLESTNEKINWIDFFDPFGILKFIKTGSFQIEQMSTIRIFGICFGFAIIFYSLIFNTETQDTDTKYDLTADIFNESLYSKKELIKIIAEEGPLSFRKENNKWYIYTFKGDIIFNQFTDSDMSQRFKLYRIPLEDIYNNSTLKTQSKKYLTNKENILKNIYSAKGIGSFSTRWVNGRAVSKYTDYELTNELELLKFDILDLDSKKIENIYASALLQNSTNKNYKNLKIKIKIYNRLNGELLSEDLHTINDPIKAGELKTIGIRYSTLNAIKENSLSYLIDIIHYDIFQ